VGCGSSPRSLSPMTGIWRPFVTRRVMLAASFPTLRLPAWTCADRFRPRSGACHRCFHLKPSGEASQPGLRVPAGTFPPDPVRTLLRFVVSGPLPQGRHRAFRSAIVGLAPRVLPLIPQVAFHFSAGRPRFRCLPMLGSYCVSVVIAGLPAPPSRITHSATARIPFPLPVATPEGFSGFYQFVQNRWMADHHTGSQ
jgi:hypothetical protein